MVAAMLLLGALSARPDTMPAEACAVRKPGTGIEAFVVLGVPPRAAARDTVVSATVCVVTARASTARIGSYHGELQFDSTRARVLRVVKPGDGMRVENRTRGGLVKFAGAAPGGFSDGTFLTVLLRLATPGQRPTLRLEMLELNGTDGANLMTQLRPATAQRP